VAAYLFWDSEKNIFHFLGLVSLIFDYIRRLPVHHTVKICVSVRQNRMADHSVHSQYYEV
jgi:hypothetical protein